METVLPQQPANPDNLPEVIGQACSPFAEEYITLSKEEHFANLDEQLVEVILVCDRYTAYKKLAKDLIII
jgi:hypothetical protein